MDFQKLYHVQDSSNTQVNELKAPKNFDLNVMPKSPERDDSLSAQLEDTATSKASEKPTDQEVNTNLNGVSAFGDHIASNFQNSTNSTTEIVQKPFNSSSEKSTVKSNGSSSASGTKKTSHSHRPEANCNRRICTNYSCRARSTPLWRKGPLGPKTLCNACGIKYMKQVTRRGSSNL